MLKFDSRIRSSKLPVDTFLLKVIKQSLRGLDTRVSPWQSQLIKRVKYPAACR